MDKCKQRLISLKDFANDTNFEKVAATIDFEEVKRNIDNSQYFATLDAEPKIYDIVGFKVISIRYFIRYVLDYNHILYFRC